MRAIDADRLLSDRMQSKYYHLPNGDIAIPLIDIENAPTIEPEQRWIPVTERLPEEKKDVLIAFEHNMAVGFWEDILDIGEPAWYVNSGDGWMTDTVHVDSDGIPLAWMPLPTPWEGGQDE